MRWIIHVISASSQLAHAFLKVDVSSHQLFFRFGIERLRWIGSSAESLLVRKAFNAYSINFYLAVEAAAHSPTVLHSNASFPPFFSANHSRRFMSDLPNWAVNLLNGAVFRSD
ncbi:hypothetical protein F4818DRAFT_184826 [Hypoxylon cercidicola]|nr:hypothetical protein F4818DRAFT_184826 [Hypoxylon cercidicola]